LRPTPPDLDDLGLQADLADLPLRAHGLVIVCGPTGSGKSTTLAALARRALEERSALLVSLEDPIEYSLEASPKPLRGVARQRQIGSDVKDFPTGLRDALREDPDVILVGEMRDPESITLALTAAETGHLVLTSLHARSAASAVERIADAYAPERQKQVRVQLADALAAVIVQRLLPSRRGGRVVAMEVLRSTSSVENLIREGRTAQFATAMQAGRDDGMLPFEKSLAALVKSGDVPLEDALAAANDRDVLLGYVR
jgi:twitching motility protein PilT